MSHMKNRIIEIQTRYLKEREELLEDFERADSNDVHAQNELLKKFSEINNMLNSCEDILKLMRGES